MGDPVEPNKPNEPPLPVEIVRDPWALAAVLSGSIWLTTVPILPLQIIGVATGAGAGIALMAHGFYSWVLVPEAIANGTRQPRNTTARYALTPARARAASAAPLPRLKTLMGFDATAEEHAAACSAFERATEAERQAICDGPLFQTPEEYEAMRRATLKELIDDMRERTEPHHHYGLDANTERELREIAAHLGTRVRGQPGDAHVPLSDLTPAHAHYVASDDSALAAMLRSVFHVTPADVAAHRLLVEKDKLH
jgi:hypothetical protein